MQLEINVGQAGRNVSSIVAVTLLMLMGIGVIGFHVTPIDDANIPTLLTPQRWHAAALARKAHSEAKVIQKDLLDLQSLLATERPDPIDAMLLAQRIYANHHLGTSATATVRQTLVDTAALAARYAAGSTSREEVVTMVNDVVGKLEMLIPSGDSESSETVRQ